VEVIEGESFIEHVMASMQTPLATPTAFVRMCAQKRVGGYRSELLHTSDFEMWLKLATLGQVARLSSIQGIVRVHGQNMSKHYFDHVVRDLKQRHQALELFFENDGKSLPGSPLLRQRGMKVLAQQAFWFGFSHLLKAKVASAKELLSFALRLSPRMVVIPPIKYLADRRRPGFGFLSRDCGIHHQARRLRELGYPTTQSR
jgi:hypothetical protein